MDLFKEPSEEYRNSMKWRLVSPQPVVQKEDGRVNEHPATLVGKTVLLYWNGKPNGDLFLRRISELLVERIADVHIVEAWEVIPATRQTDPTVEASRGVAQELASLKPDIVIGAPGDCAGSTTWLVSDQLNLERFGTPTVTVVTTPFAELARTVPTAEGFGEACLVQVPAPIGMLSSAGIKEKAEKAFEEILRAATEWQPATSDGAEAPPCRAGRIVFTGTIADINRHFLKKGWSLGLPIIPPAPELVDEMVKGSGRNPDEKLGLVPPGMGMLTVELVAVFAAMAGCRPEYMPVLVAALEAFLAPEANWRLSLSGTGTSQLIVIVNGPIVRQLGIAKGQGAAGKGYHPNGSIGYAVNMIAYTVGGSRPPSMDRSTLASPSDYVCWVFGENEPALPEGWPPLHVERGFRASDSVVTVMAAYPPAENMDHWSASVEEHMRWWSRIVSPLQNMGGPAVPQIMRQHPIIALGPEHAQLIASANWDKHAFRRAFWEHTRTPLSAWPAACGRELPAEMPGPVTEDTLVPVVLRPEQLLMVIAGGDGKQSHYFAPLPGSFPVSRVVVRKR